MTLDPAWYDAELRRYNEHFRAAADVRQGDQVLDIGCGAGQTTREAARATGRVGAVLGVDVSAAMLERARRLADEEHLDNVTFECADAETHSFAESRFDVCISRFGTMFFADPMAAFANIGRALRPGGRLVILVWQGRDDNEWATSLDEALTADGSPQPVTAASTFSLGDLATTHHILAAAGFTDVEVADVREPVFYGPDVDVAYSAVADLWKVDDRIANMEPATATRTINRLRATLEAHRTDDGVLFDSRAWIVLGVNGRRA